MFRFEIIRTYDGKGKRHIASNDDKYLHQELHPLGIRCLQVITHMSSEQIM